MKKGHGVRPRLMQITITSLPNMEIVVHAKVFALIYGLLAESARSDAMRRAHTSAGIALLAADMARFARA